MKSRLAAILIALCPYVCLLSFLIFFFFGSEFEEPASLTILLTLTAAFVLCACIAAAVRAIAAVRGGRNARELVRENMAVKLIHVPAYIFNFALGVVGLMLSVWGIGLILWAVLADIAAIALSGTIGLSAALRCKREGVMTAKAALAYALLSFIFCADVAAAVVFYRRTDARRITDA